MLQMINGSGDVSHVPSLLADQKSVYAAHATDVVVWALFLPVWRENGREALRP